MDITVNELIRSKRTAQKHQNMSDFVALALKYQKLKPHESSPGLSCAVSVGEKRKRNDYAADNLGVEQKVSNDNACGESGEVSITALKFNNFEKLKENANFAVGQTWALYDTVDRMPRLYAQIRKVSSSCFRLRITYLEPEPDDEKQIQWFEQDLPVSVGKFRLGKNKNTNDCSRFSHVIQCNEGSNTGHFTVSPRKGETWALFKNWDIKWSSEPDFHRHYEYEFVEVLSDYVHGAGVYVSYLQKAKGFASVYVRMGTGPADVFRILPHSLYRFSHRVPSFKLIGINGVPKDAYELDQDALPEKIQEIMMPLNSESQRKPKGPAIYFASKGKVFQTGLFWSFYSGYDDLPLYYGKIQKISFTQVLEQEPVLKLYVRRLKKASPFPEDVICWKEGKMPLGCGTYYPRTVVEIITPLELSHQVMPQTSMDGKEYTILPKIGEVWVIYRYWSDDIEVDDLKYCSYDIVEVLDDTLDYKVLLLEHQDLYKEEKQYEYTWFRAVTEYKSNEEGGSEPIFTIPKSERLRFSHNVPATRIRKELRGDVKELVRVESRPLPMNLLGW